MKTKTYKSKLPEITLKYKTGEQSKVKITESKDCEKILRTMFDSDTLSYSESAIAIFLNRANNTIGWFKISQGGLSKTIIDRRVLLATALNCGASAIIIAHNHPSGNKKPSNADIKMTTQINKACEIMDIQLLDHLIMTYDSYFSFADEGLLYK